MNDGLCIHGGIARKCEACDLADRLEAAEKRIAELEAQVREHVEAINRALEAIPRKTWANTARGRGIGGHSITGERDDEYDARIHEQVIRPLQLLLEKHPLLAERGK